MAEIVFGLATSHGPLLSTPPEHWERRVEADRRGAPHPYRGENYSFEELVQLRSEEDLKRKCRLEERQRRYRLCQSAIDELSGALRSHAPDALVLIGSDRREIFRESLTPTFAVFHGDELENVALDEEEVARLKPGLAVAQWAHTPEQTALYPAAPALGGHLIDSLVGDDFDVAAMRKLPRGPYGRAGIPRAFGFLYRRILEDAPIPAVLVVLNTLHAPNRPRAGRCVELGRAIARGIESFPGDARVAVLASGGLSHYVIDEEFDREVLGALEASDLDRLAELPEDRFRSGTSETKSWLVAAGALWGSGLHMRVVDYVPCYRSEAGTGGAMGFATWSA